MRDDGNEVAPITPTQTIARRVREARGRRGWTAQGLADECGKVGMPSLDRSTVANIENGRRRRIGVDELLVLAYVLDVAPVHLLVPLDEQWYAVTPEWTTGSGRVRQWVRGAHPLLSTDKRTFYSEVPEHEWEPPQPWRLTPEEAAERERAWQRMAEETGGEVHHHVKGQDDGEHQ